MNESETSELRRIRDELSAMVGRGVNEWTPEVGEWVRVNEPMARRYHGKEGVIECPLMGCDGFGVRLCGVDGTLTTAIISFFRQQLVPLWDGNYDAPALEQEYDGTRMTVVPAGCPSQWAYDVVGTNAAYKFCDISWTDDPDDVCSGYLPSEAGSVWRENPELDESVPLGYIRIPVSSLSDFSLTAASTSHILSCEFPEPNKYNTPTVKSALYGSIKKWFGVAHEGLEDEGPMNCPLCQKYYHASVSCAGCPLLSGCVGTPYSTWQDHHFRVHGGERRVKCPTCQSLALDELQYLIDKYEEIFGSGSFEETDLYKENHAWDGQWWAWENVQDPYDIDEDCLASDLSGPYPICLEGGFDDITGIERNCGVVATLYTDPSECERFYAIGDRISVGGFEGQYIIAQVGKREINLISLESGNRFTHKTQKVDRVSSIPARVISALTEGRAWKPVDVNQ